MTGTQEKPRAAHVIPPPIAGKPVSRAKPMATIGTKPKPAPAPPPVARKGAPPAVKDRQQRIQTSSFDNVGNVPASSTGGGGSGASTTNRSLAFPPPPPSLTPSVPSGNTDTDIKDNNSLPSPPPSPPASTPTMAAPRRSSQSPSSDNPKTARRSSSPFGER
eukprot:gene24696-26730_t